MHKDTKKQISNSNRPTNQQPHTHIYNLQEKSSGLYMSCRSSLSSIDNSHLCEAEVTLMGTNYIWNILLNNLKEMQRNCNQGSRRATVFFCQSTWTSSSLALDTIMNMAKCIQHFFFKIIFQKRECVQVTRSESAWYVCVHTCAHVRACRGRQNRQIWKTKGLELGVVSAWLTYSTSLFPYPCLCLSATCSEVASAR